MVSQAPKVVREALDERESPGQQDSVDSMAVPEPMVCPEALDPKEPGVSPETMVLADRVAKDRKETEDRMVCRELTGTQDSRACQGSMETTESLEETAAKERKAYPARMEAMVSPVFQEERESQDSQALLCRAHLERRETLDNKAQMASKVNPAHLDSRALKDRLETRASGAVTVSPEAQERPDHRD